jgi:hypothetical protein
MISLITILSLLVPPLSYILSGAPLGLVTLRKGGKNSFRILIGTVIIITVFGYFSNIGFGMGAAFATSVWLPVWATSIVLRITESQGMAVLVAGGIGILFVLILAFFNEELTVLWQTWIHSLIEGNFSTPEVAQLEEVFDSILPFISGIVAAGIVLSLIVTVLLARRWQSTLYNPGGFRQEFQDLLLPGWLTFLTIACFTLSILNLEDLSRLASNFLAVMLVMHVIQGIASVHRIVFIRALSKNWLILMYSFLMFLPQMALFLVCIGMVDALNRGKKSMPGDAD